MTEIEEIRYEEEPWFVTTISWDDDVITASMHWEVNDGAHAEIVFHSERGRNILPYQMDEQDALDITSPAGLRAFLMDYSMQSFWMK